MARDRVVRRGEGVGGSPRRAGASVGIEGLGGQVYKGEGSSDSPCLQGGDCLGGMSLRVSNGPLTNSLQALTAIAVLAESS